jgi:exopolyphosphatase/guanosine-5'-triphosphate,3'-diphosphate pyrophosphatase
MPGRARIAAALIGACDKPALPSELLALASEAELREAIGWGLAIRLCRRLGGGAQGALSGAALRVEGGKVVLAFDTTGADLIGEPVTADLQTLAGWLGMDAEIRVDRRLPA